jgi:hypothetical protein
MHKIEIDYFCGPKKSYAITAADTNFIRID